MEKEESAEESRAHQYLNQLEFSKVEYEPLGNVTPDFVLNNKIAVEVRRLNRNYLKDDSLVSMENFKEENKKDFSLHESEWIAKELQRNIQLVIDEKDKKIQNNFHLYNEWWLILVDFITFGKKKNVYKYLETSKFEKHKFEKIIIISPEDDFQEFEF